MAILGNNVILSIDGTAFAAAKSCEIDVQCDDIETSSPVDGDWRTYLAGRKSWTCRLSHLVQAIKTNKQMVGTTVTITVTIDGTTDTVSGSALVKEWKCTASMGNIAQGSFVFKGSGSLS